ncbi:MAG: hypothetical protein KGI50_04870 [Patescibacteria group bacterium]|nr:hypothetical protein [Patescibacteria group bacterium]MDE2438629.1 hypothetical protein [Patescibacteria group bacterium]
MNQHDHEIKNIRTKALLLCPDNDAEAHMILLLAEKAGIETIRSSQPHGARLEFEEDVEEKVRATGKNRLWIVEIPGPDTERRLKDHGIQITIIDHHTYGSLDRLSDPISGKKKPSSLEQFLEVAHIEDREMKEWGFDPYLVRGIGIMDARFIEGLREEGYTRDEIKHTLRFSEKLIQEVNPLWKHTMARAEEEWGRRTREGSYLVIRSQYGGEIRGALSYCAAADNQDTVPTIISVDNGEGISVQNISFSIVERLKRAFPEASYTFGSGRCWGVSNRNREVKVTINDILCALL